MKKIIGKYTAKRVALSDISKYLQENDIKLHGWNMDIWIVTPRQIDNAETARLNKELGLHKINKFGTRPIINKIKK